MNTHVLKNTAASTDISLFKKAINEEMNRLSLIPETLFIGQSVLYDGAAIYDSLEGVPNYKRKEMPVIEDFQLGYCIGLALAGRLPICIYPRMDFMLLAMNQLVNHLDKLPLYGWKPKLIIRTTVGQKYPLNAGPQHTQNYTREFSSMLKLVPVIEVKDVNEVRLAYETAVNSHLSTLLVENPCL